VSERERRISANPFRDAAILYAVLAVIIVAVASFTGRGLVWGLVVGVAFFVASTAWSWWRFRQRAKREGQ
jgi:cytochrome bd-type quinol oxidase subunit 2